MTLNLSPIMQLILSPWLNIKWPISDLTKRVVVGPKLRLPMGDARNQNSKETLKSKKIKELDSYVPNGLRKS